MNYIWLETATDEDREKFLRYISESIRRARSKRGWLSQMVPLWEVGLNKVNKLCQKTITI